MLFTVKKENIIEGLQKAAGIIPTRAGAAYLRFALDQRPKGKS